MLLELSVCHHRYLLFCYFCPNSGADSSNWILTLLAPQKTVVITDLCSINHYHAEWPLIAEPLINAEALEPTAKVIHAVMSLLHPTTSSASSGSLQWISKSLLGLTTRGAAPSKGTGSDSIACLFLACWNMEMRVFLHCVDNLKSLLWISEQFSYMRSLFSCNPAVTDTLLTVQDSFQTLQLLRPTSKSKQYVLQWCCFHISALLSCSSASYTGKQTLPESDSFFWQLTKNKPNLGRQQSLDMWLSLKRRGNPQKHRHMVPEKVNLPSGGVEEHNSLWPCHEGAHFQTYTEEKGISYSLCTQFTLI